MIVPINCHMPGSNGATKTDGWMTQGCLFISIYLNKKNITYEAAMKLNTEISTQPEVWFSMTTFLKSIKLLGTKMSTN